MTSELNNLKEIVINVHRKMYDSVLETDVSEHEMNFGLEIGKRAFKLGQQDILDREFKVTHDKNFKGIMTVEQFLKCIDQNIEQAKSEERERIITAVIKIIEEHQNPYPKDIFRWDNKEKLDFNRGRFNKHNWQIVENTKQDIIKEIAGDSEQEDNKIPASPSTEKEVPLKDRESCATLPSEKSPVGCGEKMDALGYVHCGDVVTENGIPQDKRFLCKKCDKKEADKK